MKITSTTLASIPEYFTKRQRMFSPQVENIAHGITLFDIPLTDDEMKYFNHSIKSLKDLFNEHRTLLSDTKLQDLVFYRLKTFTDLTEFMDVFSLPVVQLANSFRDKFNFNNISNEQILFFTAYSFFNTSGDQSYLTLEAKDGAVHFSTNTINYFSPRARDRLFMLLSVFFDKHNNIFNGIGHQEQKVIQSREYLTFLDCLSFDETYKKGSEYCYLFSNHRAVSLGDMSWVKISQMPYTPSLEKTLNSISDYLFSPFSNYQEAKHFFAFNLLTSISDLTQDKSINPEETMFYTLLKNDMTLRYNFSDVKFKMFFANLSRAKDLLEIFLDPNNTDIEKSPIKNRKKI